MNKVNYKGYDCIVRKESYAQNGSIALILLDETDHTPVATASVCLTNIPLREGHVAIKNWSENQGILDILQKANIISNTIVTVPVSQFTNAQICECLI